MKTLPKRVLLIITILFILTSCEKEETDPEITTETSNGQHLSNVTSKDIPQVMDFLE
jgi:PBP1b-binding outer membrane lipoprotein LpoB